MASQLADTCQPPPSKRLRGVSEDPEAVSECSISCLESPINDPSTFDCLEAPLGSHAESWFLPSSELGQRSSLDDPGDSGFSDGATPPASCDDSQDSFMATTTAAAGTVGCMDPTLASSHSYYGLTELECHSQPGCSKDLIDSSSLTLPILDDKIDLDLSSEMLPGGGRETNSDNSDNSEEENEDDDRISTISGLSDLSGSEWKPTAGPFTWVQRQMLSGADPRTLLQDLIAGDAEIPEHLDQLTLWKIILNMVCEPPRRKKLPDVNSLQNVVDLIKNSKNILVLTGAGVSVSCGIPDFRSRDGVYARLAEDFPDLPDPQAMFDIHYFRKNPRPFFKFAREIYPGQFEPSPCHRFIKCLEKHGSLLRNYTQNIDTLEQVVGLKRVVQCHGSFATATCMNCKYKVEADAIKKDIFDQRIPYCPKCHSPSNVSNDNGDSNSGLEAAPGMSNEAYFLAHNSSAATNNTLDSVASEMDPSHPNIIGPGCSKGKKSAPIEDTTVPPILKPDIVFFGESLGDEFHNSVAKDKNQVDLLIMIGSSLKVRPVALIPSSVDCKVPQILINREPLPHLSPDVELLGDCDGIINEICLRLGDGWEEAVHQAPLSEVQELNPLTGSEDRLSSSEPDQATGTEKQSAHLEKLRKSLSQRLPEGKFYFSPPNRYVFPGAEVLDDSDDDNTDSTRSNFGDSSSSDEEQDESSQQSNSTEQKSNQQSKEEEEATAQNLEATATSPEEEKSGESQLQLRECSP